MIFDTDVLIWVQRGNKKAAITVQKEKDRKISVQTYLELLQCATSKKQLKITRDFLSDFHFEVLPFTENIGHRAAIYIEELSLKNGMRAGDSLIAATAIENNQALLSANRKHFRDISKLDLKVFCP